MKIKYTDNDGVERIVDMVGIDAKSSSVRPMPGPQTDAKARWIDALTATPEHVSWSEGDNITELVVFASLVPGAVVTGDEYLIIAIDAASEAIGVNMLTQTEQKTANVQFIPIPLNEIVRIPLTAPLSQGPNLAGRLSMAAVGGQNLDVWVGGY